MVTFQEIYEVNQGCINGLDTEGLFVVPITWLYLMTKSGKITMCDALFEEKNFTDQMLVDLMVEFKSMTDDAFINSIYNGLIVAWCDWKGDKKWRAYHDPVSRQIVRLFYKGKSSDLLGLRLSKDANGNYIIKGPNVVNPRNARDAKANLVYAEVLYRFSKNVSFNEISRCKKLLLMS